jgi:hypothetical protein
MFAVFIFVISSIYCFGQNAPAQTPRPSEPNDERVAIERLLHGLFQAKSDFYRTKIAKAIFDFYSPTYSEVSGGSGKNLDEVRRWWKAEMNRRNLRRVLTIENIREVKVLKELAYATFYFQDKSLAKGGEEIRKGICTELMVKINGTWLVEHEHCSNLPAEGETKAQTSELPGPPAGGDETFIISDSFTVPAGGHRAAKFEVREGNRGVEGDFWATSKGSSPVEFLILSEEGYDNFKKGQSSPPYYNSGKVVADNLKNITLGPGTYYIVFNNTSPTEANFIKAEIRFAQPK